MSKKLRAMIVFLIFLNGYVSLSLELIVLRQLSFYVGSAAVITSIIMGIFLGFMSLGYFAGQWKKIKEKWIESILGGGFLIIALFAILAGSFPLITRYFTSMWSIGVQHGVAQTFLFSILLLSAAPFLFGFNTTLLARMLHKYNTSYTGNIMAVDTIGSVLGSLATTLILMPMVGVNYTLIFVVGLACVGAIVLRPKWWACIAAAAIIYFAYHINNNARLLRDFGILVNNANSTISVTHMGDTRILYMNGLPMSLYNPTTGASAEYIDYINRNFIYTMPTNRTYKILVLGAGGFTAGLADTNNDYTFVDIEKTLKDISEEKFLTQKLSDNKRFILADASQFLKNTTEKYDLILLDVYSNSYQIPEDLITAEFMTRIKSRVADNGIIVMNMVMRPNFSDKYTRVFDNTFHTVFPHNTQRQVIGPTNPWIHSDVSNIMYIYYNQENDGRIYTINKSPVIYDRY